MFKGKIAEAKGDDVFVTIERKNDRQIDRWIKKNHRNNKHKQT